MENLIINFFENIHIIFVSIFILCFIIPLIYKSARKKNRKLKGAVLNKSSILIDSVVANRIISILFWLMFFVIGLICIYVSSKNQSNSIYGMFFGILICLISIIQSYKTIKIAIKILNGNYVIILDELMDKYYYNSHDENRCFSGWRLYFKDFFKTYDKYIKVWSKKGRSYKKGDKFYLVFVKGDKYPYIFLYNEYYLSPSEKNNLKTIAEAKEYINLEEFLSEKEITNEKVVINQKRIITDFCDKTQKQTVLFDVLITITLLLLDIIIIMSNYCNLITIILMSCLLLLFFTMSVVKVNYLLNIIKNIKNNNYEIKEDEIISLNNNLRYRDSNRMISFKFKNYKNIVYADKSYFTNTQIGDKLYLVFVKGEKEPIKVYNIKNSMLEK